MIRCRKKSGLAVKAPFPGHRNFTDGGQWAMRRGSNPLSVESEYPPSIPDRFRPGEKTRTKADLADRSRAPIPTLTLLDRGP